jgi:hypothetical protein
LTAENDLICEKLLAWKRSGTGESWGMQRSLWRTGSNELRGMPSFDTWADAGLILDALHARDVTFGVYRDGAGTSRWNVQIAMRAYAFANSGPAAVRDCALRYIRSLP